MPRSGTKEVIMTTPSMKVLAAFSFLALAAAPALATENLADAAMSGVHNSMTEAADSARSAPQAQAPTRSAQNAKATQRAQDTKPALMFEKPFQKWWTED
jgi:hypothetical protein